MGDLIAWLHARLDEDDRAAQACIDEVGSERVGDPYYDDSGVADRDAFPSYPWGACDRELAFMAGPGHPARVLAEVDAKRRRLDWLAARQHDMGPEPFPTHDSCRLLVQPGALGDLEVGYCSCGLDGWRNQLYRFEALPYADRPGYQESWRP